MGKQKIKSKKGKKIGFWKKGILLFSFLVLLFFSYQFYTYFLPNFEVKSGEQFFIYVRKGDSFEDVVKQLEDHQAVKNIHSFRLWSNIKKYPQYLKVGRYEVLDGMTNQQLIYRLSRKIQSPVNLTFNNIRTKEDLCQRIGGQLMADSASIMSVLTNADDLLVYNVTSEEVVAFFIPNTYEVYWDISARDLLKRMHSEYLRFWNEERLAKSLAIGLTPIQVSTLASIVEEETNLQKDKPIIAGLYLNRLRIGMPLQACPTVKFIIGDFSLTRILYEDTQIDSPYNTYRRKGLPPGPIRVPSVESIDAVLNYTKSNYLYMCAKETMTGEHNFAATLSEHNRNAERYHQAWLKINK